MSRLVSVCALFSLLGCARSEPPAPRASAERVTVASSAEPSSPPASKGAVLVELFTSQGCSSCPPADRLLSKIGDGELGDDVIPLAFHVDYWNYIGWKDPFSKKAWSTLQRQYGKSLPRGRVYTPMLVINGAAHIVGSNARSARSEIDEARDRGSRVSLSVTRVTPAAGNEGVLTADVTWGARGDADIYLAVAESGLATDVRRGENAGRELTNDHIVRELVRIAADGAAGAKRVEIPMDPSWNPGRLELVAIARDRGSLAVLGAARE